MKQITTNYLVRSILKISKKKFKQLEKSGVLWIDFNPPCLSNEITIESSINFEKFDGYVLLWSTDLKSPEWVRQSLGLPLDRTKKIGNCLKYETTI